MGNAGVAGDRRLPSGGSPGDDGEPAGGDSSRPTDPREPERAASAADGTSPGRLNDQRVFRLALAVALVPLAVSAINLIVTVGSDYHPIADYAWTELAVRDVGRHEVLTGLYSREGWHHPGPMLFYVLAPFYWLTGGSSIGLHLGALAINGASIAGMAVVARRRGGASLALLTLLGCSLVMRTASAQFVHDPWNLFVTTLPFGLLIFLTWAMMCGERWALPAGAAVATFLVQAHVGFVVGAFPLLVVGATSLLVGAARSDDRSTRLRELVRPGLVSAVVLAVLWLPPLVEALGDGGSNLAHIVRWFRDADLERHTLAEGWRIVTAQFGAWPEWLTTKRTPGWSSQSPFLASSPLPVLLVPVAVAGWSLWRRRPADGRLLVLTLGLVLLLAIVAVARTIGPVFDYRMRMTWMAPMVAAVTVVWAAWLAVGDRWRHVAARRLVPGALIGLVAVSAVNVVTAAGDVPHESASAAVAELTSEVLVALDEQPQRAADDGVVVVTSPFAQAEWYQSSLVLQLERHGVDVRVPEDASGTIGGHRAYAGEPIRATLVVLADDATDVADQDPRLRRVAHWTWEGADELRRAERRRAELVEQMRADGVSEEVIIERVARTEVPDNEPASATALLFSGDGPVGAEAAVYMNDPHA
jgi:4-amino-4-deoxy-L-arabinose transferase-like glycosyltransferase